jgi:hypothetical protein
MEAITRCQEALSEARAGLEALEQEQAAIPGKIEATARSGDGVELGALRRRGAELPDLVATQRIVVTQRELALIDAEMADFRLQSQEAGRAVGRAQDGIQRAQAQMDEALKQHGQAQGALQSLQFQMQSLSQHRQELSRELQRQLDEVSGVEQAPAPAPRATFYEADFMPVGARQ